jgi:hypothetical protein
MGEEEETPTEMIAHYLQKIMHSNEKIAIAETKKVQMMKDVGDIIYGVIKGLLIGCGIITVGFAILVFGGTVYDYIAYDLLDYERPSFGIAVPISYEPERYEPTLDDQLVELERMAYNHQGEYVQDIYKNCVFIISYNDKIWTFDTERKSNSVICYQSMIDEIQESMKRTIGKKVYLIN